MSQSALLLQVSRTLLGRQLVTLSDRQLLERYVAGRDSNAFAALMVRHAGLVHGVCRRVLHDSHLADDVFQATFLLLSRKAASLRQSELVANWLFGVARRLSLKLQIKRERATKHERRIAAMKPESRSVQPWDDLLKILDEELERLPACYRRPLIACYLGELTHDEAAMQLNLSERTLRRRLTKGRELLRVRLNARGASLSVVVAAVAANTAKVDANVIDAAMCAISSGSTTANIASLAATSAQWTTAFKIRIGIAAILTVSLLVGGFARPKSPQAPATASRPDEKPKAVERRDRFNDPLPPGALARLGTVSLQHGGTVERFSFSPDSKTLLSIGNGIIRRWQVDAGHETEQFDLREAGRKVLQCALSPDGKTAVASYADEQNVPKSVKVFDTATRRRIREYSIPAGASQIIDMSGRLIIADGEKIDLWDENADRIEMSVPYVKGPGYLRMSSANDKLVVCDAKHLIRIFDRKSGKELRSFGAEAESTLKSHWVSPDGKWLLSRGYTLGKMTPVKNNLSSQQLIDDRFVRVWDLDKGELVGNLNPSAFANMVLSVSPDSRTALVVSTNEKFRHAIEWWDIATSKRVATWPDDLPSCARLGLSPDQKLLAFASSDGTIHLYDVASQKEIRPAAFHEGVVWQASFSSDGKSVRTLGRDRIVIDWNVENGSPIRRWREAESNAGAFTYSANCRYRVRLDPSPNGRIIVWDLEKDRLVRDFGPYRPWRGINLSNNGRYFTFVSTVGQKHSLERWDVESGKLLIQFEVEVPENERAKVSGGQLPLAIWDVPGNRYLLVCNGETQMYDGQTGRKLSYWKLPDLNESASPIYRHRWVIPSPDGRFVADSLTGSRVIQIYEIDTGKMARHLDVGDSVKGLKYSPDGKLLAMTVGDQLQSIIVCDVASGRKKLELKNCGRGDIKCLAFSPDGRKLLSGSEDCTALIWEIEP